MKAVSTLVRPTQLRAATRIGPLLLALVIGAVAATVLIYAPRMTRTESAPELPKPDGALSESTRVVLSRLPGPVELRFYSLFSAEDSPADQRSFARHVGALLTAFEQAADGRLRVTRFAEWNETNTRNAAADGVAAINLEQGQPVYLGVVVLQDSRRETLAPLSPDWLAALEFDLARAIGRVATRPPAPRGAEEVAQGITAEESLKRLIPDAAQTSLEAGREILRAAALQDFQTAVNELNRELELAGRAAVAATNETERQTARQRLQEIRARHAEALRDIGRKSQAELEAWSRLKGP